MAGRSEARLGYVPHFEVTTHEGSRVRYRDIWQRRNLVLLVVGQNEHDAAARYAAQFQTRSRDFEDAETTVVVTEDPVPGLPPPQVIVADRWGEILYRKATAPGDLAQLPDGDELLSWVHFARIQCPECPP